MGILLLGSPHLAGLRELRLANCKLRDGAIKALASNPAVTGLRVLDLGSDGSMEVAGNLFRTDGLKALTGSPHLDGLEELGLSDAWLGDEGAQCLVKATHLKGLKKLDLDGICMTDRGAQVLASSPFLARLEELTIANGAYQGTPMGEATVRAFADSPYADNLTKLDLRLYGLSDEVVEAVRARFGKRVVLDYD